MPLAPEPPPPGPTSFPGLAVLLVEDNAVLRGMMARTLESLGCSVGLAADAVEAIRLIQGGLDFQLLVSDVRMPGAMDGVALAEWMAERHPDVAILLTTGFTHTANIRFPVLAKPFGLDHLTCAMNQALGTRSAGRR